MTGSHWRNTAVQVISEIIAENPEADRRTLKRLLRDAYPFGVRRRWAYKVWLQAQRDALEALDRQRAWSHAAGEYRRRR